MTTATKARLRFAKRGDLRMVSHHDLMRCLERMLRRARIPVALSQGFNPRPRVVFTQALALGIEGCREIVELDLAEPVAPSELLDRLRSVSPAGLDWLEAELVAPGRPGHAAALAYRLEIPAEHRDAAQASLDRFLASDHWPYTRHRPDRNADVVLDLRPSVLDAELGRTGRLRFRIGITPGSSARPEEFIEALGLRDLLGQGTVLVRTELELVP